MPKYQTIEAKIILDGEEILRLDGQISRDMNECGNPQVVIYHVTESGRLAFGFSPPESMPLSDFMQKMGESYNFAFAIKERRPKEYSTSIKIEDKEN